MDIQPRHRLPVAVGASALVVLAVAAAVLLTGGGSPTPAPTASTPSTATASASVDPGATPEGAVRAFFDAYAKAREVNDPTALEPLVTSTTSSAYQSAAGFLRGQKESGKASVTTVLKLDNLTAKITGSAATVTFDYTEGGYDINPTSGSALESPVVLPAKRVTVGLRQVAGRWLVDEYQSK